MNGRSPLASSTEKTPSVQSFLRSIQDVYVYFLILLLAGIIYGKSIVYQYTYSDDIQLLVLNQKILSNLANIPKLFTTDVFISVTNPQVFYRPFLNLMFMLELQISNNSPVIFHITNILLHIGCCFLLFILFKQLKLSKPIAAAAALLFCAHPLNTSAIVWIPGGNDTLLTLLVLASFSMFLRALDTRRLWPLIGHLVLFFLALLTKESAVVLPLLCAAYVLFLKRETIERKRGVSIVVGYALLLALWFFLRSMVTRSFEIHQSLMSVLMNWTTNSPALVLYVGKAFLPFNLSIFPNLTDHSLVLGVISILAVVVLFFIRKPSTTRGIIWGLLWFFLFLAPSLTSGIIFHEHRAYCSFVGLLFAIAQMPLVQSIDFSKSSRVLGCVAILTVYSIVSMLHSEQFRNRTAYATSAYLSDPSVDVSSAGLAGLFLDERNDNEAERVLRAAIARDSTMKLVHRLLGDLYADRHEYVLAAGEYETSIRVDPLQLYAYIDYGKMCLETGRLDDAARLWKKTVIVNPEFLLGYYYLAIFYTHTRNDPDSAMIYVKQIQQRAGTVMPDLLHTIENNRLYGKRRQ